MSQYVVHLVCNAHLDPIWMWTWKEGLREAISTFRTAADLLEEFPEFIFNHNESLLYEWVEEFDLPLFQQIQSLVSKKRWHIAGGLYVQPDLNVGGGETLVRQILLGRHYFEEKFGVSPKVAYNFDTFGHPAGLPQLLRQSGYELYIHCRPMAHQLDLPASLYRWRGCDGSEIITLRPITGFYNANGPQQAQEKAKNAVQIARKLDRDILVLWGLGDHGGGATREDLYQFRTLMNAYSGSDVEIRHSTPEEFLERIYLQIDDLPVFSGELQRTHPGTYTSIAPIKRAIRESEALLASAERESAAVWWRNNQAYPKAALQEAWKYLLFNTFHDTASGTILEEAVPEVMDIFGSIRNAARRIIIKAQHAMLPAVKPRAGSIPIYVFNPHTFPLRSLVGINILREHNSTPEKKPLSLFDDRGQEIVHQEQGGPQILLTTNWQPYIGFIADVPAFRFRRYEVRCEPDRISSIHKIAISESEDSLILETNQWRAEFNREQAVLKRLILQSTGKNVLSAPVQLMVMEDVLDAWGGESRLVYNQPVSPMVALSSSQVGEFSGLDGSIGPAIRIIHSGPVFTTVECLVGWQHTRASLQYTFYAELPYIDIQIRLYMAARCKMIKLVCPFDLPGVKVTGETAYGVNHPEADGTEYPYGRWVCVENPELSIGIANSGQSGLDVQSDGSLGLSLSRGAVHIAWEGGPQLDPTKSYTWMDQGQIDTIFRIMAGTDSELIRSELVSAALSLNQPLERFFVFSPPTLPASSSEKSTVFLCVEPTTVIVGAIKKAEKENALVVRLVETVGRLTNSVVRLEGDQPQFIEMRPYQVRTFLVRRFSESFQWQESDLLETKTKP